MKNRPILKFLVYDIVQKLDTGKL